MHPSIATSTILFASQELRKYAVNLFNVTQLKVTVTSDSTVVTRWLETAIYLRDLRGLQDKHVVGLAVQWNPRNGKDSPADTLQLCVGKRYLIFQLSHADTIPRSLYEFLMHECNKFVGICNYQDEKKLKKNQGLKIHRLLDLRNYAENKNGVSMMFSSFGDVATECLGYRGIDLDPNVSSSSWDEYNLDDRQVAQASVRAFVAFEVGKRTSAWRF